MKTFGNILVCPACGSFARLTTRGEVGLNGIPEAAVYICRKYPTCDSYVGCHPGSEKPLGHLANAELRRMRVKAHNAFDWFWKSGQITRGQAYELLAEHLKLESDKAHIGMLDTDQCRSVIDYFSQRPWKRPKR